MSPTDEQDVFQIIHDAVTAQAQGTLTPEDARRLEDLVLRDADARRLYVQYVRETASLRWWATAQADQVNLRLEDARSSAEAPTLNETMVLPSVRDRDLQADERDAILVLPPVPAAPAAPPRRTFLPWAIAASVLLGVTLASVTLLTRTRQVARNVTTRPAVVMNIPTSRPVVATLTAAADAQWETDAESATPRPGAPLTTGPLHLASGAARITFNRGAEVILHGPAHVDLLSGSEIQLFTGHLTARIVDKSTGGGFSVYTPSANVVDLGTEFGVNVDAAGATEAQVLRGTVELHPVKGVASTELRAGHAALVDAAGTAATPVPYRPADFVHSMMAIDLSDVVAGGDGTQGRREAGINAITGARATAPPEFAEIDQKSDGRFHPCPELPFVAGVFIPVGATPETIDPAGHTFTFPKTDRNTWYWVWAGGRIPIKDDPKGLTAFPTKIGDVDYGTPGHGALLMRTNKGVTFDLAMLRGAHPGRTFTRFRAACVNTSITTPTPNRPVSDKSDLRILIDGQLVLEKTEILRTDPAFEISVDLPRDARYLTIAATDGGDGYHLDWITLGDPRLE